MSAHTCHIPGCGKETERRRLMCWDHWSQVPTHLQMKVKESFNPKQLEGERPSIEWLKAARYAINSVTGQGVQWPDPIPLYGE